MTPSLSLVPVAIDLSRSATAAHATGSLTILLRDGAGGLATRCPDLGLLTVAELDAVHAATGLRLDAFREAS